MDKVEVITVTHHGGRVTYYVIPAKRSDEVVDADDLYQYEDSDNPCESFYSVKKYTNWMRENEDAEIVAYSEFR